MGKNTHWQDLVVNAEASRHLSVRIVEIPHSQPVFPRLALELILCSLEDDDAVDCGTSTKHTGKGHFETKQQVPRQASAQIQII